MTDNLAIPQVAAAQNQKEVTINAATGQLSGALADFLSCDLTSGDFTVTLTNFQKYMGFATTGNSVSRVLNIPAQKRALFLVYNGGSADLTVTRGTTNITVTAGAFSMLQTDGTTNGLARVLGSSSLIQNIAFSIAGSPPASMKVLCPINQALTLPTSLTGSHFACGTNPTSTWTFTLTKIVSGTPTSIGSVSFNTSGVASVTFTGDVSFNPGDILQLQAPGSQDATGADVAFNFKANLN